MMLRRTLFLMIVCGIVAFLVLAFRLFQIQILDHDEYETAAVEQQLRETTVSAKRGTIYDRNMNILAMSATVSNIYISPAEMALYGEDPIAISEALAEILDMDFYTIYEKTQNTDSWYTTIATKVDDDIAEQVRAFKEAGYQTVDDDGNPAVDKNGDPVMAQYQGVKIEEATKRYYPYSSLASHVIGFVGSDDYGLSGIELYYDDILSGTDGRIVRATNANGTDMLFTDFEDYYDAEDGESIVLTIDETVQYYLEKELSQAVDDYWCQDGAAGIVMDVNTGAILAMASLENFDLNNYAAVSEEAQERADAATDEETKEAILAEERDTQWRNQALSSTYEPGSTFKIITLAMALESGAVTMETPFYCGGSMSVIGRTTELNCWRTSGHGAETLTEAVMNSCNIAFVNIGQKVGAETFYEYARAFGFFEKTGIDLAGESTSIWWDEDTFFDSSNLSQLAAASFGQTFTITPLQLITAVSAVANGGYLMKPYLVSEVLDSDGSIVSQTEPTVVRQVISEETSRLCCEILEQVVGDANGTGKNAYVAGYRICGKTGTSEDVVYEANTGTKQYIVSFIGFAPADDPQVAVLVLLKNPDSACGVYVSGGQMAAPTVGNIMADILPVVGVEPEYDEDEMALVDKTVPRVIGKTVEEAAALVEEQGLTYRTVGDGDTVTAQLPRSNSTVASGSEIVLYCGVEADESTVTMIDLTDLDYETARIRMSWSGLYIKVDGSLMSGSSALIKKQSVAVGTEIPVGTVVTVSLNDSSNLGRY
jgi:stage V sporulation protein D (sporulation-specific penicillin-binding protein)